jgi:hypothetical protein
LRWKGLNQDWKVAEEDAFSARRRIIMAGDFGVRLLYHSPHQSQLNTQSSGLPLRTSSLLENPLTFFTNTSHPSQTLPSVLFYKEGLYIFTQHSSKH